jgi:hypothetical protein
MEVTVETGQRFVEENQLRPWRDGACKGHSLGLASRQLVDPAARELVHLNEAEQCVHSLNPVLRSPSCPSQPIGDVPTDIEVREQVVALGDEPDGTTVGRRIGQIDPAESDVP